MFAVLRRVHHADGVRLDGDAALALQVHRVEHLRLHLARGQRAGQLQQAVGERGFAMIDVRDDREIADVLWCPWMRICSFANGSCVRCVARG